MDPKIISFSESSAPPVKWRGETISKGNSCLRLNFTNLNSRNNHISLAIKKRIFANYSDLAKNPRNCVFRFFDKMEKLILNSPLAKKFWTPVKIRYKEGEEEIYVNNNSIKKRLNTLGYIENEIDTIVQLGNLKASLEVEQVLTELSKEKKIDVLQLYSTKVSYAKEFETDSPITFSILKTLINMGMNLSEINQLISAYAKKREEWKNLEFPQKISRKLNPFNSLLPRGLHLYPHPNQKLSIYVLLNQKKKGDKIVGRGHFSVVTKAINLFTGLIAARLKTTLQQDFNPIKQITLLNSLDHPSIISLCEKNENVENNIIKTKAAIEYLTPYLNGGSLHLSHKKENFFLMNLTDDDVTFCIYSITSALDYLHKRKIIHRDIKQGNICVERDDNGLKKVYLIDFGFAVSFEDQKNEKLKTLCGTPIYLPPEYLSLSFNKSSPSYDMDVIAFTNAKLDAWAFGCFLFNFCRRQYEELKKIEFPFSKTITNKDIKKELSNFNQNWFPEPKKESLIPYAIWQLTRFNPEERWTPSQVFEFLGPEFEKKPKVRQKLLDAGIKLRWFKEEENDFDLNKN